MDRNLFSRRRCVQPGQQQVPATRTERPGHISTKKQHGLQGQDEAVPQGRPAAWSRPWATGQTAVGTTSHEQTRGGSRVRRDPRETAAPRERTTVASRDGKQSHRSAHKAAEAPPPPGPGATKAPGRDGSLSSRRRGAARSHRSQRPTPRNSGAGG